MIGRFVDLVVYNRVYEASAKAIRDAQAVQGVEDGQCGRESVVRFRNLRTGYVRLVDFKVHLLTSRASRRSQMVAVGPPALSARGAMTAPRPVTPASSEFIGHTPPYRRRNTFRSSEQRNPIKQPSSTDLPPLIHALLLAIAVSAIAGWALTQLIP